MKYLLDTCVLLWALEGDFLKLADFTEIIRNEDNLIIVSVVSYWEIIIKKKLGKLEVPDGLLEAIETLGFIWMNVEIKHVEQFEKLPLLHHDPFDRLLISQALSEGVQLLTHDQKILQYNLLG